MAARRLPTRSNSTDSGVGGSSSVSSSAICPMAVRRPVATTTARPRPAAIDVPAYTIEVRSPSDESAGAGSMPFATGRDSPVSAASSASMWMASTTLASAGTRAPGSRTTRSPGTSSALRSDSSSPPRTTRASGADSSLRAASASAARDSWT